VSLDPRVKEVLSNYEAAYDYKEELGLHDDWVDFDDYTFGRVNEPSSEEDPGSETNIILPVVESLVADTVDQPLETLLIGEEPSDHAFSMHIQQIIRWILDKNQLPFKLDKGEHHRTKFGIGVPKVYYSPDALRGRGLPVIDFISPVSFMPDPKVTSIENFQEGDFAAHAMYKSIGWVKRHPIYGSRAKALRPYEYFSPRDMRIFEDETTEGGYEEISRNKCLFVEMWSKDIWEGKCYLRLRVTANNILLYDSKEDMKTRGSLNFYRHGRYPMVPIPCYAREGVLWGVGDVELLIPTQDLINDLDDQIRRNARLMGNIQKVIGIASGINPKKWTNKAGLNIVARDHEAWKMVQPPSMPAYIENRRNMAINFESQLISGRTDATEGRKMGSLRAAAAVLALQEAGNKRVNHKRFLLQAGLKEVVELLIDYVKEYFTEERAYRIVGSKNEDYIWFRGSQLQSIPRLIPSPTVNQETGEEEFGLSPLVGSDGNPMMKEAMFDIKVSIGAGLPNNMAFLYQSVTELHQMGLITTEEARMFLKERLNFPVIDPLNPVGTFAGRNVPPDVTAMMNQQQGIPMPSGGQPFGNTEQGIPPEILNNLITAMGGGQVAS